MIKEDDGNLRDVDIENDSVRKRSKESNIDNFYNGD